MQTREELLALPGAELINIHNTLNPSAPLTPPWKRAKDRLVDIIEALQNEQAEASTASSETPAAPDPEPAAEVVEEPAKVEETAPQAPSQVPDDIDPVKPMGETVALSDADKARLPLPGKTIRETALRLLAFVHYHEDRSRACGPENRVDESHPKAGSVGLTYLDVISLIKEAFPDANTSVACLRWYAVKVRAEEKGYEGWTLTRRRPRLIPPRAAKEAAA